MKTISIDQEAALYAPHSIVVFLVELQFSTPQYVALMGYDITWNGHTWKGMGNIIGIEPIKENITLTAVGLKLSLTGVPSDMVSLALSEKIQGKLCKVYMAVFDTATHQIIDDPVQEYRGLMNVPTIEDDFTGGMQNSQVSTISISVEGRLADMFRTNIRRYTNADQLKEYPADKFFEFMPQMTEKVAIWPGVGWSP